MAVACQSVEAEPNFTQIAITHDCLHGFVRNSKAVFKSSRLYGHCTQKQGYCFENNL